MAKTPIRVMMSGGAVLMALAGVEPRLAAIYPGNSGGPLLDSAGRLIGVNTISYALTGSHAALGFAIPVELAQRIVPELISNGRISTPGIGIIPADETTAARFRIEGVVIARIESGSPAERAGLESSNLSRGQRGDVISAANGRPVRNAFDLRHQIEQLGIGSRIELTVDRDGSRM
jgi:S1-C subfamily serine protease